MKFSESLSTSICVVLHMNSEILVCLCEDLGQTEFHI